MSSLRYRTIKNKVFFYTTCFLASLTVIPLFAIIWELIKKGYSYDNLIKYFNKNMAADEIKTFAHRLANMKKHNSGGN